jgi:preprotein translocase subunit SecA
MERLGLEDDVAIESGIVGKTIESAQSRVEGFNFDMRKRVVEYDDVINRQRETIYEERNKVLRNEDLSDTVQAFLEDEIGVLIDSHLSGESVDDWGMEGLAAAIKTMGLGDEPGTSEDDLWDLGGRDAIREHHLDVADAKLEAKAKEVGEEDWAMVERLVLLRTIDSLWVEHLTEVDDMRRGIGLRGYAQQDPLNEFRREAYRPYEELSGLIRHQVASSIFRVTVTRQPQEAAPMTFDASQLPRAGAAPRGTAAAAGGAAGSASSGSGVATAGQRPAGTPQGGAIAATGGGLAADPMARALRESTNGSPSSGVKPGFTPSGARIGRNDLCYCGSGLKYKKCHGR